MILNRYLLAQLPRILGELGLGPCTTQTTRILMRMRTILIGIQHINLRQMPCLILLAQTHQQQQEEVLQYPHLYLIEGEVVGALVDLLFNTVGVVVVEVPRLSQGQTNLSLLHQPLLP